MIFECQLIPIRGAAGEPGRMDKKGVGPVIERVMSHVERRGNVGGKVFGLLGGAPNAGYDDFLCADFFVPPAEDFYALLARKVQAASRMRPHGHSHLWRLAQLLSCAGSAPSASRWAVGYT